MLLLKTSVSVGKRGLSLASKMETMNNCPAGWDEGRVLFNILRIKGCFVLSDYMHVCVKCIQNY